MDSRKESPEETRERLRREELKKTTTDQLTHNIYFQRFEGIFLDCF
ncbi:DUF6366 family protein [Paenibacillus naphthalenovorans]|nr:DUF6366 family protein [Paenibacillus naphthalenovorans]